MNLEKEFGRLWGSAGDPLREFSVWRGRQVRKGLKEAVALEGNGIPGRRNGQSKGTEA